MPVSGPGAKISRFSGASGSTRTAARAARGRRRDHGRRGRRAPCRATAARRRRCGWTGRCAGRGSGRSCEAEAVHASIIAAERPARAASAPSVTVPPRMPLGCGPGAPASGYALAPVDDAHGLALGALDGLGLLELHRDLDVEHVVDLRLHPALEALQVAHRLGEDVLADLDPHLDDVEVALAIDDDLVVRLDLGDAHQHLFDLAGEHVDAADDQHVVAASDGLAHARGRAPASARLGDEAAQVARAVADQRLGLAAKAS